jgi:MFS family permease
VSSASGTYGRLFRREIVDICIFIFIADIVTGVPTPIFSLYATSLGASLGLLGVVTAMLGLGRLLAALPVGMLSDALDRKTVLVGGMLTFVVAFTTFALVPGAGWLAIPRLLQAVAMVSTFPLGIAYIGDVVEVRDRGAAIGLYTAAMGAGFAVGPLIGSSLGAGIGYPAAYVAGAAIALGGAVFGALRLVRKRSGGGAPSLAHGLVDLPALRALARHPMMLMACIANVVMTLSMTGAIFTYFPIYARGVGISTVTIGGLFAWRALASATGRIPTGAFASRIPARWTLAGVLVVEAAVDVAIAHTTSAALLTAFLIVEGVAFGVFLVSGQSAVAAASGQGNRGAAVGMFWMSGSVGDFAGPILLGVVAQSLGVVAVFDGVGATVIVGALLVGGLGALDAYRSGGQNPRQDGAVDVAAGDDTHDATVAAETLHARGH